ncbi:hypothetical protein ACT3CE_08185 [Marinifilum sp. RC60d5]|uniref:hypothetical protein n=1 Tax=Marinifilum sp. RC60d5 TaxID=3458414 RepID=UPI004036CDC2
MKIIIKRPLEKVNKRISYPIYIGGKKIIELKNGEEKELEVKYSVLLSAKINWCGSKEISLLKDGEVLKVQGNVFFSAYLPFLTALMPVLAIFIFNNIGGEVIKIVFSVILILLIVFCLLSLSFLRKHWISIQRIE